MEGYPVAKTPTRAAKTYRRHGDLPAYFQWRDGRPTWNPSQGLRDAGWRRHDLRDDADDWLTKGAAIDRAALINDAVGLWREGQSVPAVWAAFAPAGATADRPTIRRAEDRFSIGALADEWAGVTAPFKGGALTTLTKKPSDDFAELQPSTQRDYRRKLKRLIDVLAGYPDAPRPVPVERHALAKIADLDARRAEWAAYQQAIADTRADPIFSLAAEEDAEGVIDPLYEVYRLLKKHAGVAQAAGVLAVAGVWLSWCRARKSRRIHNWAKEVSRETPRGRIRPLSWPELSCLIRTADEMGWHSIADGTVLGLDLSWSQTDRLQLEWPRVKTDDNGRLRAWTRSQLTDGPDVERVGRAKTGRVGGTPFLKIGRERIEQIAERHRKRDAHPTHVLWCETTAAPWKADHYRKVFALVRARAAVTMPSLADVTDQDLRDTAITLCRAAGLSIDATCSRTLQSRRRVLDLWDQAYGEIGPEIADAGADQLDAYLADRVAL
jgi:hypothetical protein